MAEKTFSTEQIQIRYCGIVSFKAENDDEKPLRPAAIQGYSFQIKVKLGTTEGDWLRVLLLVTCTANPTDETEKPLDGNITTECLFNIAGLDEILKEKEDGAVPQSIAVTAVSIAYSTTRGLLASKAGGTFLEGAVLPIVQPGVLLTPDTQTLQHIKLNIT